MIIKIDASSKYRCWGGPRETPWFYCEGDSIKIWAYLSSEDLERMTEDGILPVPPEDGVWLMPSECRRGGELISGPSSWSGATVVEVRKGNQETHIVFDGEAYILNDAGKTIDHIESVSQRMKVKQPE